MQTQKASKQQKHYRHLVQEERDRMQALLDEGIDESEIGRILGRSKSTIGREIVRNKRMRGVIAASNAQGYDASSANHKAYLRRLYASYQGKHIQEHDDLRAYIIRSLKQHWTPDEIAGAMKEQKQPFYASKTAIYEWLYSEWGQRYCPYLPSGHYKPKKRTPKAKRQMIPDRVSVHERSQAANDRAEYGHHEADTIVSGKRTGSTAALAVDLERKGRYVSIRKIPNLKPDTFVKAMRNIHAVFTADGTKTCAYDNGIENRQYQKLRTKGYFCDPYSPWQKGGVENVNHMIRAYVPKGCDIDTVSYQRLTRIAAIINNKPRKILGYKSALQVMRENDLLEGKSK